jgi:hypothetical protein
LIPVHYFGWTIILLAVLRFFDKADLSRRWNLAFSIFTALYSLGRLSLAYNYTDIANVFYILSVASIIIPFVKIKGTWIKDAEKVSEVSKLLGIGIIVLLS